MKFTRSLLLFCNFRWVVKIVWKLSFTPAGFQVENLRIRVSGRLNCRSRPGSGLEIKFFSGSKKSGFWKPRPGRKFPGQVARPVAEPSSHFTLQKYIHDNNTIVIYQFVIYSSLSSFLHLRTNRFLVISYSWNQ